MSPVLPRQVLGARGVARQFNAAVQVMRIKVPGPVAIVPPEFPTFDEYGLVDIGDLVIPAYAVVLFVQLFCEYRSTDPENEEAYSSLTLSLFLDGENPNTGNTNLELNVNAVPGTADWTTAADTEEAVYDYGEQGVYMYGSLFDDSGEGDEPSGEGSEFRNISAFIAYIEP